AASEGDYRGVQGIAAEVRRPVLAALARCVERDVDLAGEALRPAARGRIHVFISTSDIHLTHKLKIGREDCLEMARAAVRRARSLAAIEAGVGQVECTVNGIGERAGNAALEEIVMASRVRPQVVDFRCNVDTREIYRTSRLLSHLTGVFPQPNKAVVGRNAFAHEAGIHQHGVMQNGLTYEIMRPETVGVPRSTLVLGKHSGRHALERRYHELGYELGEGALERVYHKFTALADKKRQILD